MSEKCAVCGECIDHAWATEWNWFAYEAAPFCRRESVPANYDERQGWLMDRARSAA